MFNISDAEDFDIVTNRAAKAAVWKQINRIPTRSDLHAVIASLSKCAHDLPDSHQVKLGMPVNSNFCDTIAIVMKLSR